jgi:hypothetical protein
MTTTSREISSPFIYGQILNRSLHEETLNKSSRVGIGTCLSQGALVAASLNVLLSVFALLMSSSRLVIVFLPIYFAVNGVMGIFQGVWLWVWMRLLPWRLGVPARAVISSAGLLIYLLALGWVLSIIFVHLRLADQIAREQSISALVLGIVILLFPGTLFAIIIGSTLDPWPALWKGFGRVRAPDWLPSQIVGVVLRSIVVCLLMESTLLLMSMVMFDSPFTELVISLIAAGHSLLALIATFSSLRFGILSLLTLIANVPVVYLLPNLDMSSSEASFIFGCFVIAYLTLWAAYLLTRSAIVYSASKFIWAEIRYYLID